MLGERLPITMVSRRTLCLKLIQPDGSVLGVTGHDTSLAVDGVNYEPNAGFRCAPIRTATLDDRTFTDIQLSIDAVSGTKALLSRSGLGGSRAELVFVDWRQPAAGAAPVCAGEVSNIQRNRNSVEFTIVSDLDRIANGYLPTYSALCRAELGDAACRVDLARFDRVATVRSIDASARKLVVDPPPGDGALVASVLIMRGQAAGGVVRVLEATADAIRVTSVPGGLAPGEMIMIRPACDGQLTTCHGRFENVINFRGEPDLPGDDALLRSPNL